MNDLQVRYLAAINQQLGGPIRAAMPDKMSAYLLDCVFSISTRVLVDVELGGELRGSLRQALIDQRAALAAVLDGSAEGRTLLAEVEQISAAGAAADGIDAVAGRVAKFLMRLATPASLRIAQALVSVDADNWQRIQSEVEKRRAAAAQRVDREVDAMTPEEQQRLLALLRTECGEVESLSIQAVSTVPGGYSKQTIIVTLANHRILPAQIVIRRDRAESPVGSTVVDELDLLKLLYESGLKVPRPWLLDTGSVMGSPIMVVSKVEGHTIGDTYAIFEKDERYALDLADQLAKLHAIPLSRVRPDMPGRHISNLDFMRQDLALFHGIWQQTGESSVTMDAGDEWLHSHIEWAETQQTLIHRDTRFHNILCHDGELTALLDWELTMVGHPARDLGWAYHQVAQITDWDRFIARYEQSGGPHCSPESLAFYAFWSEWYCAVQMYRARAAFNAGVAPFAYAYAGEEMRQQNVNDVAQRLQQIMSKGRL